MEQETVFTRNAHGVMVKACCASCQFRRIAGDKGRLCGRTGEDVAAAHRCEHWEMSRRLENAGMSGGRVKSWQYLCHYRKRWMAQRDALAAGRINALQLLSAHDIRREYKELYGSIYCEGV